MRIEAERLILRDMCMDDLDALHEILSDAEYTVNPDSLTESRNALDETLELIRTKNE